MTVLLTWGPMPRPDGAPYKCGAAAGATAVVDSTKRCEQEPRQTMPMDNFALDPDLRQEFSLTGRCICDFHMQHIAAYVADRNVTDPDYALEEAK